MKRTILLVAFGVAFVGVSLWLILSGGRSRRATRLKYRLGGAILSLVALTSTPFLYANVDKYLSMPSGNITAMVLPLFSG